MNLNVTSLSLMYLLAACINLASAVINVVRPRIRKGTGILSLTLLSVGIWLLGGFFETAVVEPVFKFTFVVMEDMLSVSYTVLIFYFSTDYFDLWAWFRPYRWILWIPVVLNAFLDLTNGLHHWFWISSMPGPVGSNVTFFLHGPYYLAANLYFLVWPLVSLFLVCYHSIKSSGWERWLAFYIAAALFSPFAAYLLLAYSPDELAGFQALPFGYGFSAMLIGWSVLEDYRRADKERNLSLQLSVNELEQEVFKREQLEQQLRQSHDALSFQLAEQSSKLSGLYDLILVGSTATSSDNLTDQLLDRIAATLDCRQILFIQLNEHKQLQIESFCGIGLDPKLLRRPFPSAWLPFSSDVRADPSTQRSIDLPAELRQENDAAALYKWVKVRDRNLGLLAVYWQAGHSFTVDEISLFSACTDGFGLVLENARLRQIIADSAFVQERRRLARDLHDSVTQSLNSLVLSSQTALDEHIDPQRLRRVLGRLDTSARQALKEMRLLLYEMRLASPDETGLLELLGNRLDAVERRAGIHAELLVSSDAAWPREWEAQLYPLTMEALNNSLKHAQARNVSLSFSGAWYNLQVEIRDDGQGFHPESLQSGGMGLKTMAERCETLGARFEIISKPSSGTIIRVKMQDKTVPDKESTHE